MKKYYRIIQDKESASVRNAISLLEGDLARSYGYTLDRNYINFGDGSRMPITTQVYLRLVELGYDKKDMSTSDVVYAPNMSLEEMRNYCDMYSCIPTQVGEHRYKLEGADGYRVIQELKSDGFVQDSNSIRRKRDSYIDMKLAKKLNKNFHIGRVNDDDIEYKLDRYCRLLENSLKEWTERMGYTFDQSLDRNKFSWERGRKYYKVINNGGVHSFVDVEGNIYKPASWDRPASGIRATLDNPDTDWAGSGLYR